MELVLLPGMDGTGRGFEAFLGVAGGRYPISVATYPPDEVLGYRELLPHARRAVPAAGPYVLVGESFSGPLAIELAAAAERPPAALVLAASFAKSPVPFGAALFRAMARPLFGILRVGDLRPVRPRVLAHRLREITRVDVRESLAEVRAPILYLRGARDLLVGGRGLRGVREVRPDVAAAELRCGHFILKRRPAAALEEIERFLSRLPSSPPPGPARAKPS